MRKRLCILRMLVLTLFLSACNFNKTIKTETLNHISTVIMNSNVKISTSTYTIDFFKRNDGPFKGGGSGVIIDKQVIGFDTFYYLLTNNHVVHLNDNYLHDIIIEDVYNKTTRAELVVRNQDYDLAILRFKSNDDLLVIELAKDNPSISEIVFSVGSPSGMNNIITAGEIVQYSKIDSVDYEVIVHKAYIHKGSSGSMLINNKYELVGINTWGFIKEDEFDNFVVGGATPIEKILEFLDEIEFK